MKTGNLKVFSKWLSSMVNLDYSPADFMSCKSKSHWKALQSNIRSLIDIVIETSTVGTGMSRKILAVFHQKTFG